MMLMGDATLDAMRDVVRSVYLNYLGREPDAAGLDWWATTSVNLGLSADEVKKRILAGAAADGEIAWRQSDLKNQTPTVQATSYQQQVWSTADDVIQANTPAATAAVTPAPSTGQTVTAASTAGQIATSLINTLRSSTSNGLTTTTQTQQQAAANLPAGVDASQPSKLPLILLGLGGLFLLLR